MVKKRSLLLTTVEFGGGDGYYSEEETDLDDDEGDCLDSDEETLAPDIEKMKEDYQRADGYVNYFSDFQEPFQYDDDLPIYHVAQISLMKILNYILPATSIKMPLVVVRDFGAKDSVSYLHCLAEHKWGQIFSRSIKSFMDERQQL
ncbi:hypothetical protein THAOC_14230 [Thalassiosira oceanica]|uniref:Uncharacterized protein n=1 Tax=Thalassiosira oceanica TaxID=159749 RepID=K0T3G5_THAOC|nr:hypothetical protein THAOC_14230 [Thalassiosira oceanica]|eukprot:EJK64977.1 hypothetical protein THAOC_14230 [Thalassiosira oceanica]